jgi:hypothetical protein
MIQLHLKPFTSFLKIYMGLSFNERGYNWIKTSQGRNYNQQLYTYRRTITITVRTMTNTKSQQLQPIISW